MLNKTFYCFIALLLSLFLVRAYSARLYTCAASHEGKDFVIAMLLPMGHIMCCYSSWPHCTPSCLHDAISMVRPENWARVKGGDVRKCIYSDPAKCAVRY